jgi:hypothetical protein
MTAAAVTSDPHYRLCRGCSLTEMEPVTQEAAFRVAHAPRSDDMTCVVVRVEEG